MAMAIIKIEKVSILMTSGRSKRVRISELRQKGTPQEQSANLGYLKILKKVSQILDTCYHPSRSSLHNKRALTTRDITKVLSQGQQRGPFTYQDYKEKWDRIKSKDGKIIRGLLGPYKAKHQEPSRVKTHWDYVLDEVEYMYIDFKEELKF